MGYRDGIVAGEVDRAAIIEECARVAELWPFGNIEIANAIRALKEDKPRTMR